MQKLGMKRFFGGICVRKLPRIWILIFLDPIWALLGPLALLDPLGPFGTLGPFGPFGPFGTLGPFGPFGPFGTLGLLGPGLADW